MKLHLTAAEAIYRNWLVREKPLGLVVSPRSFESVVVLHNSAKHAVSPPSPQADLGRRTQTTCVDNLKVGGNDRVCMNLIPLSSVSKASEEYDLQMLENTSATSLENLALRPGASK